MTEMLPLARQTRWNSEQQNFITGSAGSQDSLGPYGSPTPKYQDNPIANGMVHGRQSLSQAPVGKQVLLRSRVLDRRPEGVDLDC